jgi:tetratricopeptide (TPR) repeat protein
VLDFGIAQIVAAEHTITQLTHGGNPLSPAYASPEQLRGERSLSPASDVYSLGVIGYEMLSGERLFGGRGDSLEHATVHPLRERRPEVPAGVAEVIARAMEADPARRFADAGLLAEALDAALHAPPAAAADHRVLPRVYRARQRPRLPEEPASPVPREGRGGPARFVLTLAALALVAGAGWWAFAADSDPERVARDLPTAGAEAAGTTPAAGPEAGEAGGVEEPMAAAVEEPSTAPAEGVPAGWARNAQALHRDGLEMFRNGSYAGAAERLRMAVQLEPDNVHFRNNLAWALFRAGDVEAASAELERVLQRDPGRAIAHANLGEVRLAQGDTAAAVTAYRRFLELNDDPRRERIARAKLERIGG